MEQSEDAILFCACLVRIRRADLAADFCLRGNRYILPFDGGIRNLDRSICLTAHEISAIPFCAGRDRNVAACRVHVCLVNDDRALGLEGFRFRRYTDSRQCDITLAESSGDRSRRGIDLHQLISIFIGGFLRCVSACMIHMRADNRTVQRSIACAQRYIACAHDHIALGIDLPLKRDVTAVGDCFRLFGGGLLQMAFHTAIVQSFAIGGIRAQRQPSHVEYTVRADSNACIGEEIHIPADLVILDRVDNTINVDAVLDQVDLAIDRGSELEIRHVLLSNTEIRELVQGTAIVDLLVVDVILYATTCELGLIHLVSVRRIRHRHVRIDEIASRAPACDGKEQCRPCAGEDTPAAACTLLALMSLHQLRSDHIAAARGIPYDFVYFIHKTVLLWVRRSWK